MTQIEENIYQLPIEGQLVLMERIAQNIRNVIAKRNEVDIILAEMSKDPEI
ncbi:MAG: hypothetical protein JXA42_08920 [Anaerolineales bacterium]|nr:hypothetical protein [Anaerolineales bacterium]